jgi:hypothetical protein
MGSLRARSESELRNACIITGNYLNSKTFNRVPVRMYPLFQYWSSGVLVLCVKLSLISLLYIKMDMQRFGLLYFVLIINLVAGFMSSTRQSHQLETKITTSATKLLTSDSSKSHKSFVLMARLSDKRKKELGVADDEDEYDLSQALNANTDPLITKLIAGSLILVILGLLTVAVIIPLTSETVDGLCNPILNAGRC